jgi:hypothetical protein
MQQQQQQQQSKMYTRGALHALAGKKIGLSKKRKKKTVFLLLVQLSGLSHFLCVIYPPSSWGIRPRLTLDFIGRCFCCWG